MCYEPITVNKVANLLPWFPFISVWWFSFTVTRTMATTDYIKITFPSTWKIVTSFKCAIIGFA
jgi:hypothetical protein